MIEPRFPSDPLPNDALDLLAVAAHPDDAEISVGGTLINAAAAGLRVGILDLTTGEPTPHGTIPLRIEEAAKATAELGVAWRGNLNLPNRSLAADLDSRRALAEMFRHLRPRILLAHHAEDVHPDHVAASALVDHARFWAKLSKSDLTGEPFFPQRVYHFWSVHLRQIPAPSFVVDISDVIEQKMAAIRAYESQITTGRSTQFPTILDDVRDRARYWGWSIGKAYAEPLLSRETIGVTSLDDLIV